MLYYSTKKPLVEILRIIILQVVPGDSAQFSWKNWLLWKMDSMTLYPIKVLPLPKPFLPQTPPDENSLVFSNLELASLDF